jgi:hypothetical protein
VVCGPVRPFFPLLLLHLSSTSRQLQLQSACQPGLPFLRFTTPPLLLHVPTIVTPSSPFAFRLCVLFQFTAFSEFRSCFNKSIAYCEIVSTERASINTIHHLNCFHRTGIELSRTFLCRTAYDGYRSSNLNLNRRSSTSSSWQRGPPTWTTNA